MRNSFLVKPDLQSPCRRLRLSSSFAGWVTARYPAVIIKGTGIKQREEKKILLYGTHLALNGLMFAVFLAGFNICARRKPHFSLSCSCSPSKWLLPASPRGSQPLGNLSAELLPCGHPALAAAAAFKGCQQDGEGLQDALATAGQTEADTDAAEDHGSGIRTCLFDSPWAAPWPRGAAGCCSHLPLWWGKASCAGVTTRPHRCCSLWEVRSSRARLKAEIHEGLLAFKHSPWPALPLF